ncbi:unnamed protein product [Amoebophrya sp. A120]|nr:unnamed protein product [Amoebophrya sp. A120]|eukprot:GSA120T00000585001.1
MVGKVLLEPEDRRENENAIYAGTKAPPPAPPALRHAEKERKFSTCSFADRVCNCVLSCYRTQREDQELFPGLLAPAAPWSSSSEATSELLLQSSKAFLKQTCIAGFVLFDSEANEMRCVSFGVGTKFRKYDAPKNQCVVHLEQRMPGGGGGIAEGDAQEILSKQSCKKTALYDLHAEVLAKRALMRWLARADEEVVRELAGVGQHQEHLQHETAATHADQDAEPNKPAHVIHHGKNASTVTPEGGRRIRNEDTTQQDSRENLPNYRSKPPNKFKYSLHMYVSSAPCGNACIRRWGKGGLGPSFPDLPDSAWPRLEDVDKNDEKVDDEQSKSHAAGFNFITRPKFSFFAKKEGQGAFLQKGPKEINFNYGNSDARYPSGETETSNMANEEPTLDQAVEDHHAAEVQNKLRAEREKLFSGQPVQYWRPSCQATPLSCSDKILKWQVLGFQGRVLLQRLLRHSSTTAGAGGAAAAASSRPFSSAPAPEEAEVIQFKDFYPAVRIATLVCGRKFVDGHLNRAVWERYNVNVAVSSRFGGSSSSSSSGEGRSVVPPLASRKIACLVTSVKSDEGVYDCASAVTNQEQSCVDAAGVPTSSVRPHMTQQADFSDPRCMWWAAPGTGDVIGGKAKGEGEVLDGRTGMVFRDARLNLLKEDEAGRRLSAERSCGPRVESGQKEQEEAPGTPHHLEKPSLLLFSNMERDNFYLPSKTTNETASAAAALLEVEGNKNLHLQRQQSRARVEHAEALYDARKRELYQFFQRHTPTTA